MRKFIPLLIVLSAFGVYEARHFFVEPKSLSTASVDQVENDSISMVTDSVTDQREASTRHGVIKKGEPFFVAMTTMGVSPLEIQRLVTASKKHFNFRRVKPGQDFTVYAAADNRLDSLRFEIDAETALLATRDGDAFLCRLQTIPHRSEHFVTSGTITSSIYETLQQNDANPELAAHLAVIFQWDIDFFKDIRKGDSFTILYENKIFGDGTRKLRKVLAARVYTQGENHYGFRYAVTEGPENFFDAGGKSLQKSLLRAPLRYSRVSSGFTSRRLHPVHKRYKPHYGVDYAAPQGTPIRSTGDGTVIAAAYHRGNGKYVKIRHNKRYTTYYLHMSRFANGVRKGRRVKQGQVIGYVGSTGISTGPHLDYRIKVNDRYVNPRTVKLPSKTPVPSKEMARFGVTRDGFLLRIMEGSFGGTVTVDAPSHPLRARMTNVS